MKKMAKNILSGSWRDINKHIESSLHQDVTDIELWDDKIKEKEKEEREKDATPKEEDWDAPEAQTEPGNGLMWDDMIPRDPEVQPTWVVDQEHELMEPSLPWRRDPEGTCSGTPAQGGGSEKKGSVHHPQTRAGSTCTSWSRGRRAHGPEKTFSGNIQIQKNTSWKKSKKKYANLKEKRKKNILFST